MWDYKELMSRIAEKKQMRLEDIASRKIETYNRILN